MNLANLNSTLESIKPFVESSASSNFKTIGDNFRSRLMAMKDIHDSVEKFFRDNMDFLIKNSPRSDVRAYTNINTRYVRLGKTDYIKYDNESYDVVIKTDYPSGKFMAVEINHIHEDYRKQLGCSGYEYDHTAIATATKGQFFDILNGDYSSLNVNNIESIDKDIKRGEDYYNKVMLPMVEIFLNNIKEFQKSRCEKIRSFGTEPTTKKVNIEIEYMN